MSRFGAAMALACLLGLINAPAEGLELAKDGVSAYEIVLDADATVPERTAAEELQTHLEAVTGARLPIHVETAASSTGKRIVVGPSAHFLKAFPDFNLATLRRDGIVMKTAGDTLFLAGDRPRGTLYAVYTFLEDVAGCRWWAADASFTPKKPTLEIPALDTVYVPKLLCREAFYRGAFDGVFAARSKCNGHFERVSPEYGGHYTILGWCHTFNQLLPPSEYFETHPEWYSEIDGKRSADRTQLCLTNDEMRAELTKKALERIRKDPTSGIISISQNDWHGQCQCAACRAVEEEEGSPSGPILRFVNAVAEDIEREFPDMLVETLAYSYTRQAPKHVKPRKNVIIRLCSIECSYSQPLATGPQNETFRRDIENWSAIAPRLYIWNYVTNFRNYIMPHPNMRVLAPNIRFFIEHNAVGLFEQGDSSCSCSDFPELRAWVLAHLMWDPARDENALIKEFLEGYYGPAAEPLAAYIDLIHDAVEESGAYLRCYMSDTSEWFDLPAVNRAAELFDEAETRVAGNDALLTRVRRARMPLDHVWLNRYRGLRREARRQKLPFNGPEDPVAFVNTFIERAHAFRAGSYREGRPFAEYEQRLRRRFRVPSPPPVECAGLPEEQWIDIQDNEMTLAAPGKWSDYYEDSAASDGMVARMPADHTQWAVQYPVSEDMNELGDVRCYVSARCDAKAGEGQAFRMGIYDAEAKAGVTDRIVRIEDAKGTAYRTFDLGVHALKPSMYFWVAPVNNPDQVEAVLVDRIFCIHEN